MLKTTRKDRLAFAERLNQAINEAPIDAPISWGRQRYIGKLFGVDYKAARKWLVGEGFPTLEKSIEIAKRLNVALEWLLTGRGEKRVMEEMNAQLARLLDLWWQMGDKGQDRLLIYAKFLVEESRTTPSTGTSDTGERKPKIQH